MSRVPAAAAPPPANSTPVTGEAGCTLYVGNLHPQVTEAMLHEVFQAAGTACSIKIIVNKKMPSSSHYGFVVFADHEAAQRARDTLNGQAVRDQAMKINWAFNHAFEHRDDTQRQYHIFVGDLAPDVDDQSLMQAFMQFSSLSNANVVRDHDTGKSRGYGFVVFGDKADAYSVVHTMNGYRLGSRPIRVNWATHRAAGTGHSKNCQPSLSFGTVVTQTPPHNTTVYVGNLPHQTTPGQVAGLFQAFGYIVSTHFQFDRGYAFVK
ncbi:E3 ubiquitin-protein ligase pub1 [Dimargaris xerosporica]|nr:E3 ubiquitin-protein ligase pub1 [Dimargaris xerosporica]